MNSQAIPLLLKTVQSKRIDAKQLITRHFTPDQILDAYGTFSKAADTKALKVMIETWKRNLYLKQYGMRCVTCELIGVKLVLICV